MSRDRCHCWGIAAALLLIASGCAVDRKSLSYDSQSKMPWLDFSLMPAKKTDSSSYHRPISRPVPKGKSQPPLTLTKSDTKPKSLTGWLTPQKAKPVLPLPRTDLNEDGEPMVAKNTTAIEF